MSYVSVRRRNHLVRPINQWRARWGLDALDELRRGARTPQDNPVSNSFPPPQPSVDLESSFLQGRVIATFPNKEHAVSGWKAWKEDLLPDLPNRYVDRWYERGLGFLTCEGRWIYRTSPAYLRTDKWRRAINQHVNRSIECCGEVPLPHALSRFLRSFFEGAYERYYRSLRIRVPSLFVDPTECLTEREKESVR